MDNIKIICNFNNEGQTFQEIIEEIILKKIENLKRD